MARQERQRLTATQRRAEIVEAALEEFATHGFSGTRTRSIASRAGVSETLVFQHFRDKESLYGAALEHLFGGHPVLPDVAAAMARDDDEAVFGHLAGHVLEHTDNDPRIIRLALFSALEGRSPDRDDGGGHPVDLLRAYIERRVAAGAFRPVDPWATALLFVEAVYMHAADRQVPISVAGAADIARQEAARLLADVFARGLRP